MTSSSKRRASSSKQSSAGKAQVISVGRKDALPRTGNVSPGRRKPAVPSPVDAPKQPLAKALARSNKKAPKPQQTETSASRTKTARTAGRASGKRNMAGAMEVVRAAVAPGTVEAATPVPVAEKRPADVVEAPAVIAPAIEPEVVTVLEALAETAGAVEAATADEVSTLAVLKPPEGEALAIVETEVEVEASAISEETPIVEGPFAPAPHHGKRALVTAASRLLSMLCRWTGVRQ